MLTSEFRPTFNCTRDKDFCFGQGRSTVKFTRKIVEACCGLELCLAFVTTA